MEKPALRPNAPGGYRFLPIEGRPFSAALAVDDGLDLVHVTFDRPLPLDRGLRAAAEAVRDAGRPIVAVAGFELRIPEPFTAQSFGSFNDGYAARLRALGVEVDGLLPAGRTNVVPIVGRVTEPCLHAFSYTAPGRRGVRAFLVSGVPESTAGTMSSRLDSILDQLETRLGEVGATWRDVTAVQLYGDDEVGGADVAGVLRRVGAPSVRWFPARPPIDTLTLEIDVRSAGLEVILTPGAD